MAKKKKYKPRKDDDWDAEAEKEHIQIIREKERAVKEKYNKWWDQNNKCWREGFNTDS